MSSRSALLAAPAMGVLLGLAGAFVHVLRSDVLGVSVPWGLVLAGSAVVACIRAATVLAGRRVAALLVFLGWLAVTLMAARPTASGDLPLQEGWRSTAYLLGTVVVGSALMVISPPAAASAPTREPLDA